VATVVVRAEGSLSLGSGLALDMGGGGACAQLELNGGRGVTCGGHAPCYTMRLPAQVLDGTLNATQREPQRDPKPSGALSTCTCTAGEA